MIDIRNIRTLAELARHGGEAYGDLPALKLEGAKDCVSHSELDRLSLAVAGGLASVGVKAGDRVLLFCESRPEWLIVLFGIWKLGATAVPLPVDTPSEMLGLVYGHAEAAVVVASRRNREMVPESLPVALVESLVESDARASESVGPEIALLGFTSGSTARPRAVELTQENLVANLRSLLAKRNTPTESNFLSVLPPAHLFELMVGQLGPLACGATVVYARTLMPNRLIDTLRTERISGVILVPALFRVLVEELAGGFAELAAKAGGLGNWLAQECDEHGRAAFRDALRKRIGPELAMIALGGSAHDPGWAGLAEVMGIRLEVGYGLTEASPIVSLEDASVCPPGSVGRPLEGIETMVSESGELLVRGPNVMRGYFKDPEATREALADGWLHTGDKGEVDGNGYVFIRGRLKEAMVTEGGDTIYPEDIEPHYESAMFAEHCVVPFRGDHGNDMPVLCVVPADGAGELEAEFGRLRSEAPGRFRMGMMRVLGQRLPRTATGKIQRRALAQQLQEKEAMHE